MWQVTITRNSDSFIICTAQFVDQATCAAWLANYQSQLPDPSTWTATYADVTAQVALNALAAKGLKAQQLGASIIAQIFAINETNLLSGALTSGQFTSLLADTTAANIERCLRNGSIATALILAQGWGAISTYYSAPQIAAIEALMVPPS